MKHDRIDAPEAEALRPASYIAQLRRPAGVIPFPAAAPVPSVATCELLAETALEYARAEAPDRAQRAANDAVKMAAALLEEETPSGRSVIASAMIVAGDAFILLVEMHRAVEAFELAIGAFDALNDLGGGARARFGLATALRELGDARARSVLEDAGELYEEIGDQTTVHVIDRLLRELQSDFEETPRSFHSSARLFRVKPLRP